MRSIDALEQLLATSPYGRLPKNSKRVVTFMREVPLSPPVLPLVRRDATVQACIGREAFSSYVPSLKAPDFLRVLETTFGVHITTRTWETVERIVRASAR